MNRPFLNEEQQAFIDKLKANFTREELRLLPQIFETWMEDEDYQLGQHYETTEVYNDVYTFPVYTSYNFDIALFSTDEELQQLNEGRQKEMDFLLDDNAEGTVDSSLPF